MNFKANTTSSAVSGSRRKRFNVNKYPRFFDVDLDNGPLSFLGDPYSLKTILFVHTVYMGFGAFLWSFAGRGQWKVGAMMGALVSLVFLAAHPNGIGRELVDRDAENIAGVL